MWIKTLPVYSKLANESAVPPEIAERVPEGWQLSQHQVETYRALTEGDAEVIFNTAMTGDGKSLAGQLPALIHGGLRSALMAMYPTNELVRDQQGQLQGSKQQWKADLQTGVLNSARLDEIMAMDVYAQRGEALLGELRNHDIVLTNPDIFHLIMEQFYLRQGDATDKIIGPMVQKFQQFTFDEFHIFETPQVISVLNALLFIQQVTEPTRPHKFLFLSATPRDLMLEYLDRSGLDVQEILGKYMHSDTAPDTSQWRRILNGTTVHFDTCRVEEWVEAHLEGTLLPFFNDRKPHAKGAIIVNSVATAHRLLDLLQPVFAEHGLTVEPNTGLTSRQRRRASYEADLLIGTSTVDVGVDFQINFLLFESRDAGSFLQRLGRLGRHDFYARNGKKYPFQDFVAYALVPPWIAESLFVGRDQETPLLQGGETTDREQLNKAIEQAYPLTATFDHYASLWGKLQSVHIIRGLSNPTIREQYAPIRSALGKRYEATFDIQLRSAFGLYQRLRKEQKALLDEVISFRGGSYFTCGVIDETEGGEIKTADLFQLVANAKLGALDERSFYQAVKRKGLTKRTFEQHEPVAFFRLFGWREERQNYQLVLDCDISGWGADRFGQAMLLRGWQLDASVPGLATLNNHLSRRKLPSLLCVGYHPLELKRRLRLPLLFAVYEFKSRDLISGCVAFGREALLLDTRLRYSQLKCGGGAVIL
jgi:CRISPR-associated endonuclease/helicase Cas3